MKLEDLRPGLYRIARDTKNPKPDRRVTRDWRAAEVWPAGGVVSVVFEEIDLIADDPTAVIITAQPYSGLDGARYPLSNAVKLGIRTAKRGFRLTNIDFDKAIAPALLEALEPHEPRNVDEAIRMFNDSDTHAPEVSYREIALQLLSESPDSTLAVLARVQTRLKQGETDAAFGFRLVPR